MARTPGDIFASACTFISDLVFRTRITPAAAAAAGCFFCLQLFQYVVVFVVGVLVLVFLVLNCNDVFCCFAVLLFCCFATFFYLIRTCCFVLHQVCITVVLFCDFLLFLLLWQTLKLLQKKIRAGVGVTLVSRSAPPFALRPSRARDSELTARSPDVRRYRRQAARARCP